MTHDLCKISHFFTNQATAVIDNAVFNGTFCDSSQGTISHSEDMEVELCFPEGAVVDPLGAS